MNTREKPVFDVLGKIETERLKRNWSEYALAKNAGLPQSTISTWYRRQLQPSIASIEKICSAFGISLSQFFSNENNNEILTENQREIFEIWSKLCPEQRKYLLQMLNSFI